MTGTSSAVYDRIDWAQAEFCSAGIAFEKASIVGGQFLTGGASFIKGTRNTPLFSPATKHYMEQVEWLTGKNMILYDVDERRAWLIDGALAMLHLMCTRLSQRPYRSNPACQLEKLSYANCADGADAGYIALTNAANMKLEVFREEHSWEEKVDNFISASIVEKRTTTTITQFSDLVTQAWYVVEEMFAHQARLQTTSGVNLRFTTRDKLEGYDFMDVAKGESPLKPRFVTLNASGKGWVDLVRSIGAVCLLGSGFGDLILPSEKDRGLCRRWHHVPFGRDYLATTVSTVKQIRRRNASKNVVGGVFQVAQGVYWHQHDKLFGACHCKSSRWKESCDRVQTLLPASIGAKRPPADLLDPKYENGAVIFGRGKRCPYHWPKDPGKDPEEHVLQEDSDGDEEDDDEEEHRDLHANMTAEDSGLGTSLSTGASHSFNSASASFLASAAVSLPTQSPSDPISPLHQESITEATSDFEVDADADVNVECTSALVLQPAEKSISNLSPTRIPAVENCGAGTLSPQSMAPKYVGVGVLAAMEPGEHIRSDSAAVGSSRSRLFLRTKEFTKRRWQRLNK